MSREYPKWKDTQYSHDDTLTGAYCRTCHWAYAYHEAAIPPRCPFIPMFDDPHFNDPEEWLAEEQHNFSD